MKKNLLKNIGKSILVTNFVVLILILIYLTVTNVIAHNMYISDAHDEDFSEMYISAGEQIEENYLGDLEGTEKYEKLGNYIFLLQTTVKADLISTISFSILFSIIVGAIIGYIITQVETNPNGTVLKRKSIAVYFTGAIVPLGILLIMYMSSNIFYIIDDYILVIAYLAIFIIWSIIYCIILKRNISSAKKQANELKIAFNNLKKNLNH